MIWRRAKARLLASASETAFKANLRHELILLTNQRNPAENGIYVVKV